MVKVLRKNKVCKLLCASIIPISVTSSPLCVTSCSVTKVLFDTQGQSNLYLSSNCRVVHTLVVQNIDLHDTTFTYEIHSTNISGIDISDPNLVSYTIDEDYTNGNMNVHYSLSSIFYEKIMELSEVEREGKYVELKTTFIDNSTTIRKSITSKFIFDKSPIITQTINVKSENGIDPTTYYSGEKYAAGIYDPFDVINDYTLPNPDDFTMDQKQKIVDILNADISNTIDRTIENFRFWFTYYQFEFDILDINWSYKYDAIVGEFESIELNGNCKCTKWGAQVAFHAKFRNCKLIGAYNEDKSFGAPHTRYDGKQVYANMLQFVPQTEDDVDVTYWIDFQVPFLGFSIFYNEKYFLNPRNFFGVEQFDTHGTERGFTLESYYLSNYLNNENIDWLNNPPTSSINPLQVNIQPINVSDMIDLTNVHIKNNWTHTDINGKNTRKSTEDEFKGGNHQDGFTSRHVLNVKDSNPPSGSYSNWIHTPSEFASCFPDQDDNGNDVNTFKTVEIDGTEYPWYQVFCIVEYDKNGKLDFFPNSVFTYDGGHSVGVDFVYSNSN